MQVFDRLSVHVCSVSVSFCGGKFDGAQEEETEEAIPESYYYPIESNEIKNWPQGPAIEAASATVLDMDSGTFLYSKNAEEKQYPASITKIMTTLLLVENCDLDDEITFSDIVYDLEEGSSHLGIQPGEKMKLNGTLPTGLCWLLPTIFPTEWPSISAEASADLPI